MYDEHDLPPLIPVTYTIRQRERMCENAVSLIPRKEFIGWVDTREPGDATLHLIKFKSELGIAREKIISAFECPTNPSVYVEIYTDQQLKETKARALIRKDQIPSVRNWQY